MDWRRFLEENNIHFVDRGPNTKRGEVSIQCPLCGDEDPSEHLGINLTNGKWGCHRDSSHRGLAARSLIKHILGCSSPQSALIVKQYSHSDPDTLEAALAALNVDDNEVVKHDEDVVRLAARQKLEPQFEDFYQIKPRGITKRFFTYLAERGYDNPQEVIERYGLRCAMTGRYKDRVIIPIRHSDELLGWTSRAIGMVKDAPRYLMSSDDVKTTVFNYDQLKKGGERLFIVEGPFDAIKIDNHSLTHVPPTLVGDHNLVHYRATCTFGTSLTVSQLAILRAMVKGFDETWILFDRGAEGPAETLSSWLGVPTMGLPDFIDDPGELKDYHLERLSSKAFNGWWGLAGLSGLVGTTLSNRTGQIAQGIARNSGLWGKTRKP